jgi:hypothetical protein
MLPAQSHPDAPIPALLYTVITVRSFSFCYFRSRVLIIHHPQAILEVFLLGLAGYILAAKGTLDKKTQKVRLMPATSALPKPLRAALDILAIESFECVSIHPSSLVF